MRFSFREEVHHLVPRVTTMTKDMFDTNSITWQCNLEQLETTTEYLEGAVNLCCSQAAIGLPDGER